MTSSISIDNTFPNLTGIVFNIQHMSVHDGPGIRTTVFLKGCPLRCQWCHNPEGLIAAPQLAFTLQRCIACRECTPICPNAAHSTRNGIHTFHRDRCKTCFTCAESCPTGAIERIGLAKTVQEIMDDVLKDVPFYESSGGGLTLSGGEPMTQFAFTRALLKTARAHGLHTCVETCGMAPRQHFDEILPLTSLFLFDCKETDPAQHDLLTGTSNQTILDNLRHLDDSHAPIILRCPLIPGANYTPTHLEGIAKLAQSLNHLQVVQLIGHHRLGQHKWTRLGLNDPPAYPSISPSELHQAAQTLIQFGVNNVEIE